MELKKTTKADLENKRNYFIQFGLIVALGIVLMAFNLNDKVKSADSLGKLNAQTVENEIIPITRAEEVKPQPPPPPPKVIEVLTVVDDNSKIDDDIEFESTEANDATIIDATPVIKSEETSDDDDVIFITSEDPPQFPGGDLALLKWLTEHVNYPTSAAEMGVSGMVYVSFVVDRDGGISNAKVIRSVFPALDQEALRVVNSLPKWKPGMQGGKAVRVSFSVPINFKMGY